MVILNVFKGLVLNLPIEPNRSHVKITITVACVVRRIKLNHVSIFFSINSFVVLSQTLSVYIQRYNVLCLTYIMYIVLRTYRV